MIINLHGFNSAGKNNAFVQLSARFEPGVPVLSPSYTVHNFTRGLTEIENAMQAAADFSIDRNPVFVGSSTGALFAEMLAKRYKGRVVLINPVVDPAQLKPLIGPQKNYATGIEYEFTQEDLDTFQAVEVDLSLPRLVFIEDGDEKLDHRLTRVRYKEHAQIHVSNGNSHRYEHWPEALLAIDDRYFGGELSENDLLAEPEALA